ncbi:hypothetical protein OROHE_011641 [Orobanche hederae]
MAATMDVRQEEGFMNFGGQNYFDIFPRLERRGRIPRRERTNYYWRSSSSDQQTAPITEKQQEEARDDVVAVEDKSRETAADEATDQEESLTTTPGEESERSSDDRGMEEREIQEQELDPEKNDVFASGTQGSVDLESKKSADDDEGETTFDQILAEERETTPDEEEAEKLDDHDDGRVEEREIREQESDQSEKENSVEPEPHQRSADNEGATITLENPTGESETPDEEIERSNDIIVSATQSPVELGPKKSADEGETNPAGIPAEERETSPDERERVSADGELFHHESGYYLFFGTFPALIRRPKIQEREATAEERGNNQEKKLLDEQKSDGGEMTETVAVGEELYQVEKSTSDVKLEEEEGAVEESEAQERNETLEKSSDERETSEGGERENIQDLETAAVIRPQETQVEEEEEEINFGGNNYEKHFPKIERRERITKRERRGEYA